MKDKNTEIREAIDAGNRALSALEEAARRYSPQISSRLEGEYQELTFYGDDIRLRPKF